MGGEPERKHRAWFLDRQRRLVLRGGGVALPAVPCRRALKIHRTPPRRARLARPSSRQPATPSENLVRHPPSGQRPKASTSTRPELPYVELRAPPRRRPRRQYGDGSMSAASWNTSQTILDPGNRAAETWTAGRGGRVANGAGWVGPQGGRYFVYRPGWTANEIPSTLGLSRPLDRDCTVVIAADRDARSPRDVLLAVVARPAASASFTPAQAPARSRWRLRSLPRRGQAGGAGRGHPLASAVAGQ